MTFEWTLYARNPALGREGVIEDYREATLTPIYTDVGTWSVTLNRNSAQAANLVQPGWGIIAVRNGVTVLSGPATHRKHTVRRNGDKDVNEVVVSGVTDEVVLKRRLVSPSPTESAPPYSVQASDIRTGTASTILSQYVDVNAGPGAVTARRTPGLTIATDPVAGASVTGNGRWDSTLLAFLQPLATSGGVGFRVAQVGSGLQFQVFTPTDRTSSVQFSVGLGNLAGFDYESTAPETNYCYVGAIGTGTSRVMQEFPDPESVAQWGRIEGPLVNQSATSDPAQLTQAAVDTFATQGEQAALSIIPVETPNLMFGVHYFLGDRVTVQLEGPAATPYAESGQIQDILRSVEIKLTADGPQTVTPTIGTAARSDVSRMFRKLLRLDQRVNDLERQ